MVGDYRHHPIIIYRCFGTIEEKLIDHLYDLRNTHALRGKPPWVNIYVMDFTEMVPFSATVRKYTADKQVADPNLPNLKILTIPIVANPLLRGVMTAVVWMTGKEKLATEFAATIPEGIAKGLKTLSSWDVPLPAGLDPATYKFPTEHELVFRQT
jgi:hypothetical protein